MVIHIWFQNKLSLIPFVVRVVFLCQQHYKFREVYFMCTCLLHTRKEKNRVVFCFFTLTSFFEVHLVFMHFPSCILAEVISAILLKNLVENYLTLL